MWWRLVGWINGMGYFVVTGLQVSMSCLVWVCPLRWHYLEEDPVLSSPYWACPYIQTCWQGFASPEIWLYGHGWHYVRLRPICLVESNRQCLWAGCWDMQWAIHVCHNRSSFEGSAQECNLARFSGTLTHCEVWPKTVCFKIVHIKNFKFCINTTLRFFSIQPTSGLHANDINETNEPITGHTWEVPHKKILGTCSMHNHCNVQHHILPGNWRWDHKNYNLTSSQCLQQQNKAQPMQQIGTKPYKTTMHNYPNPLCTSIAPPKAAHQQWNWCTQMMMHRSVKIQGGWNMTGTDCV